MRRILTLPFPDVVTHFIHWLMPLVLCETASVISTGRPVAIMTLTVLRT